MHRCLLPQSEQDELRAGVSSAQAEFFESKALILRIYGYALEGISRISEGNYMVLIEEMLDRHEELISAQNLAIKAGLTAKGE